MSETHSNRDAASNTALWGFYSVITVSFEDDDNAYVALALLKELDSRHRVGMDEAVLVMRDAEGRVVVKDRVASAPVPNTIGGGLVGLLVGIIGGPLGMLIGATAGVFTGSLFDIEDADQTNSALSAISSSARPGHNTLLAVVREQSREVVDVAMSRLGGTVLRRPVQDVQAEIAAVEQSERTAKREAHEGLLRGRADANHANHVTTSHPPEHQATGMGNRRLQSEPESADLS